jgi:threonine synthase
MRFGFRCLRCAKEYPGDVRRWRCECGAPFALEDSLPFSRETIDTDILSIWRYRAMLPVTKIISLGEGHTPLIEVELYEQKVACKLEYLAPTGSFKDRGTTVLVSALVEMGIKRVVEDSSGNAGASLAAYCARAGIETQIYVPAQASSEKLAQIEAYGAKLIPIAGPRERAAQAAQKAAERDYYASHYWNPLPQEGIKTEAYEICEDLGWQAPKKVIVPVGQGTHLLGLYQGFRDLLEAKLIQKVPRLYGVQAIACSPLYEAFRGHASMKPRPTVAEGISIGEPTRGGEVLEAVRATEGEMLAVTDEETLQARDMIARRGLYVEPTSAVAVAALKQLSPRSEGVTVISLTGSGLKSPKE